MLLEPSKIGDRSCYRVQIVRPDGTAILSIDQESFVLRRMEFPVEELVRSAGEPKLENVSLTAEFADAAAAHPEWRGARTYPDLPSLERQTPTFWNQHVRPRLDRELEGTWRYLSAPWPNGPNPYIERIERNIARLRSQHAAV